DISQKDDGLKLLLPTNIVPERQMDFAFMQITAQTTAACNRDFNQLFIPFRCVSTDIYHNKAVIHKEGDVGLAIRASMTFPLVYKPVEKDGALLFDGGIVNNFPWDVMHKEFNPDIIIGHKVTNLGEKPDPDDIFSQIETMVTQETNYEIPDSLGLTFETKLNEVGLLDFPKANYINSKGIETALGAIDTIESLMHRKIPKEELQDRRRKFNNKKPEFLFNNIQVEGVKDNAQRRYIIQSIKYNERVINLKELRESYYKLIADEQIESIQPLAYYNRQTGYFDLHLKVEPSKPLDVEFGGHLSTRANTFGFIEGNYKIFKNRAFNLSSNLFFGRFYNSFKTGGRIDTPTRNPFYISAYYTLNLWDYSATSTELIFTDIKTSNIKQTEQNAIIQIGTPFSKNGIVDFGISWSRANDQYNQLNLFNFEDEPDETIFNGYSAQISIDRKNYDYKQYPTSGGRKLFSVKYVTGKEEFLPGTTSPIEENISKNHDYFQINAFFDEYFPLNDLFTVGALAQATINNNTLYSNYTSSALNAPAFNPTPNSKSLYLEQYRTNQFFAIGGKFIYNISQNLHFRTELHGFAPIRSIQVINEDKTAKFSNNIFPDFHLMGMTGIVSQTRLGPLSVEVNYYDKPGQKWFFSVNMGYMIFNKRGF
ncbi:MAG TPA: patatin-like phospholipase family protein, partial [Prolixibacteraceae bacterium]|nr:patatin-like phospholipase family protein [Prolixibacteraceae bacterium]